jgi:hypothetical protein
MSPSISEPASRAEEGDMSEDRYWVHTEDAHGTRPGWYGPYSSQARAEEEAESRTAPFTGTYEFAEVVCGHTGERARRVCEYLQGGRHHPGGSGWRSPEPATEINIPMCCESTLAQ